MDEREVVLGLAFPPNEQAAEAIVPRVGPLDDPAARLPARAAGQGRFAAAPNVRDDAAPPHRRLGIGVVIPFVETQVRRPARASGRAHDDVIEHLADLPLVVHVRAGDARGDGHPPPVGQNVPFHAAFRAVRRVRPGGAPPLGAFTVALSNDVHVH